MGWFVECDCYANCPCFSFLFANANAHEDEDCDCDYYCDRYGNTDEVVERNWTWKWDTDIHGNPK